MAAVPQFIQPVEEILDETSGAPRGEIDLAPALAETLARDPFAMGRMTGTDELDGRPSVLVRDVVHSLPEELRAAAWQGRIAFPGLSDRIEAFAASVGGPDDFRRLADLFDRLRSAERRVDGLERELAKVAAARWEPDPTVFGMVYGEQLRDDYAVPEDLDATLNSYAFESYRKEHPAPDWRDKDATAAWDRAYEAWVRAEAEPYLYGTTDTAFSGLTGEAVRERYVVSGPGEPLEVDDGFDVWSLVESELEDHHEDAAEKVVDEEGLLAAFEAWKPHAGTGSPEDLALDAALAAWSAKQTIVSYYRDDAVIVPAFPDATHDEAVAWIGARLEEARRAAEAVRNSWEPGPAPEAVPPAEAVQEGAPAFR